MDTIEGMRVFVSVASELSFTAGAKRLSISTKIASKYVQQLEARLEAQLFNRTTRSVTLTETGLAYFDRCRSLLDQFDELEGMVQERQSELAGPIRISAPTAFGSSQLVAALRPFQMAHPKVVIDLQLADQRVALIDEGFDIAIRFGSLEDSTLMARKLLDMRVVIVASPEYLKKNGRPRHPKALATHNCLLFRTAVKPTQWSFLINGKTASYKVDGSFRANSPRAIAHMAAGGLGIGRCPVYIAKSFIEQGKLTLLFEDMEEPGFSLHALFNQSRHQTARIRALIDHLVDFYRQAD